MRRRDCRVWRRHSAGGDDQRRQRRDIAGRMSVAAGADDVDRRAGAACDGQHARAHGAYGAGISSDGLAAHVQSHQKSANLGRRDIA